jgi:anti-sigma regulatory factor (Ser/Thr protein kinase)
MKAGGMRHLQPSSLVLKRVISNMKGSKNKFTLEGETGVQIFRANFTSLDEVREFVGKAAIRCGLEEDAVYAVQMATDEAFTNIVEHAYGGECLESVQCSYQISSKGLEISLKDCGQIFDPAVIPEPNLHASLEEREVGGLGLYFMRQLMDKVDFVFEPGMEEGKGCNIVTMFKRKRR